jgi:ferredoxin-NADP reductase
MPPPPTFRARLVGSRALTPAVRELAFERTDGAPLAFDAGQWLQVVLPLPSGEIRRSYSIASAPNGTPRFELAITHVDGGPGSTYLHALSPGSELDFVGPQGFFTRPLATATPSLFVATGTGVTPFRSMMHAAIAAKHATPMRLVLGVRTEADILYRDEWERMAAENAHVRVDFTLSRPTDTWPASSLRGYVQTHVRAMHAELAALGVGAPHVYVCGLERMIREVRELVRKQMELPRQQVHSERYD